MFIRFRLVILILIMVGCRARNSKQSDSMLTATDDIQQMTARPDGRFDVQCKDGAREIVSIEQLQKGNVCLASTQANIEKITDYLCETLRCTSEGRKIIERSANGASLEPARYVCEEKLRCNFDGWAEVLVASRRRADLDVARYLCEEKYRCTFDGWVSALKSSSSSASLDTAKFICIDQTSCTWDGWISVLNASKSGASLESTKYICIEKFNCTIDGWIDVLAATSKGLPFEKVKEECEIDYRCTLEGWISALKGE